MKFEWNNSGKGECTIQAIPISANTGARGLESGIQILNIYINWLIFVIYQKT